MLKKLCVFVIVLCMLFTSVVCMNTHAITYPVSGGTSDKTTVYLDSYGKIGMN